MTYNKNLTFYKFVKEIANPKSKLFLDGFEQIDPKLWNIEELKKMLIKFHQKYYIPAKMTVNVITGLDLSLFRDILDKELLKIT